MVGAAAGCVNVGVRRIELPAGGWSTPAHEHGREEEIFYVLSGRGLSWQAGEAAEIRAGDCIVYLAGGGAHTRARARAARRAGLRRAQRRRERRLPAPRDVVRRQPHGRLAARRDRRRRDPVRARVPARPARAPTGARATATHDRQSGGRRGGHRRAHPRGPDPAQPRPRRRVGQDRDPARRGRTRQGVGAAPLPLARGGDLRDPRRRRRARARRRGDAGPSRARDLASGRDRGRPHVPGRRRAGSPTSPTGCAIPPTSATTPARTRSRSAGSA